MRSENIAEVLKLKGNSLLTQIMASSSCQITIVETDDPDDIFNISDMVNEFLVAKKHLIVIVPTLDFQAFQSLLTVMSSQNLTINYDVEIVFSHKSAGKNVMWFHDYL